MNGRKRLTEEQVATIKLRLEAGDTQEHLSYVYDVSQSVISQIKTGKAWRDVKPMSAKYDPLVATDPETNETIFLKPSPKPLPRWDGADTQAAYRRQMVAIYGQGARPCVAGNNNWIGCPYGPANHQSTCPATEKVVDGEKLLLDCTQKPGGPGPAPMGYYPPAPKIAKVIAEAKQNDEERRRRHTKAVTVQKAKKPGRFASLQVPEPKRMRQYVAGEWKTRIFVNGRWQDEPDRSEPQSTAG